MSKIKQVEEARELILNLTIRELGESGMMENLIKLNSSINDVLKIINLKYIDLLK